MLLPALGLGVLENASLLQGKNAVDNFHITGTFNFSFGLSYVHEGGLL